MNSELIYHDLLNQYNNLSDQEKQAIMIYKSSLFYHINSISKVDDFENKSADEIFILLDDNNSFVNKFVIFKREIELPKNMIVRYSIFKDISFDDILSFIDSMKNVYQILKDARIKIKLCDDIKVYRGISVKKDTVINKVSNSKLVSTSIKVDDANDFIYQSTTDESHLFVISLKKGTNVLVTPLSFIRKYEDSVSMLYNDIKKSTLKIVNCDLGGQSEIILFSDDLNFNMISERTLDLGEDSDLIVHDVIAEPKLENNYNKNK